MHKFLDTKIDLKWVIAIAFFAGGLVYLVKLVPDISAKVEKHDKDIAVLQECATTLKTDMSEMKLDIKTLLRRSTR